MVQREVADRFFAKPSTKAYGAVSVLVQLVAERTGFHPVSPQRCSGPRPNVDSALVAFRRTGLPHDFRRVKRVVEGSFAHRRKRLANSLELAGVAARGPAEEAIALIGRAPNVRAEELAPQEFLALAEALEMTRAPAAAKINLSLVVGPVRADGKHEVVTVYQRVALSDRIAVERAPELRVAGFADDTLVRRALERMADGNGGELRRADPEAHSCRRRAGRRQLRRGDRVAAGERACEQSRIRPNGCTRSRASSVQTFRTSWRTGRSSARATAPSSSPLDLPQDYWILLVLPRNAEKSSTERVYADFDARGGERGYEERRASLLDALERVKRPRDLAALPPNDLASSPLARSSSSSVRSEPTSRAPARRSTHSSCTATTRAQRRSESPPKGAPGSRHQRGTVDHMAYSQPMIEAGSTRIGPLAARTATASRSLGRRDRRASRCAHARPDEVDRPRHRCDPARVLHGRGPQHALGCRASALVDRRGLAGARDPRRHPRLRSRARGDRRDRTLRGCSPLRISSRTLGAPKLSLRWGVAKW